ncbi:uncharacterized protein KIAA1143 homolog [Bemisia tabaci]|uniref:uncharacterized protein KIAA1143 homolog n=1 Tax=Bemisia tabaci TaxID=7038 RepID=UPI003B2853C7
MSKRKQVAYIKPREPSFLAKLKAEIGYRDEGPTVDTKRERLPHDNADDIEDREEDQPTVVVLKPGDLTAEEASAAAAQKKKEEEEAPADLSKGIKFRKPVKASGAEATTDEPPKKMKKKAKSNVKLLSFDEDEDDED